MFSAKFYLLLLFVYLVGNREVRKMNNRQSFVLGFFVCAVFGLAGYAVRWFNPYSLYWIGYYLLIFSYIISLPVAMIVLAFIHNKVEWKYYVVGAMIGTILDFGLLFLYLMSGIGANPA